MRTNMRSSRFVDNYSDNYELRAIRMREDCTIEASNVMTVNNDGVNDNLIIDGVEFWPNTMLKIYDRWGKLVFESENYQNDWNGNVKDSNRKAPAGTYYYFVQRSIDPAPQTGFLTLLRED